jgi:hypothetical protein
MAGYSAGNLYHLFLLLAVGKKLPWFMLVAAFLVGSLRLFTGYGCS